MGHIICCLMWQLRIHMTSLRNSFGSLACLYVLRYIASCRVYNELSEYNCWMYQPTTLSSVCLHKPPSFKPNSLIQIAGPILVKCIFPFHLCTLLLQPTFISLIVKILPLWLKYCFFVKAALMLPAWRDSWLRCLALGLWAIEIPWKN